MNEICKGLNRQGKELEINLTFIQIVNKKERKKERKKHMIEIKQKYKEKRILNWCDR